MILKKKRKKKIIFWSRKIFQNAEWRRKLWKIKKNLKKCRLQCRGSSLFKILKKAEKNIDI